MVRGVDKCVVGISSAYLGSDGLSVTLAKNIAPKIAVGIRKKARKINRDIVSIHSII